MITTDHLTTERMPDDDFLGPLMKGMGFGFGFVVQKNTTRPDWHGSVNSYWWSVQGTPTFLLIRKRSDNDPDDPVCPEFLLSGLYRLQGGCLQSNRAGGLDA